MQSYTFLTASAIVDAAKAEAIGSTDSSLTALQDTQLLERIEHINSTFVNAAYTRHSNGGWSWMKTQKPFNTKAHTTLNGAVTAGDATFILTSGTDFDSSGRVIIETSNNALDFVDYESKATNTLTVSTTAGDDVIDIDHATSSRVEKLYALPTNFGKTRRLYVNGAEYFYEDEDRWPVYNRYTFNDSYIWMPRGIGAQDITHYYYKKPSTIDELTDNTDIPTNFQRYAIEMALAHVFRIRRKRADMPTSLELAEIALQEALAYDTDATSGLYSSIDTDY